MSIRSSFAVVVCALASVAVVQAAMLGQRKNIVDLTASEMLALRDAVRVAQEQNIWSAVAADHGIPNAYCPHGSDIFLPWHRRFLWRFESRVGIALPYWDFTNTEPSQLPSCFTDTTYVDGKGVLRSNPLRLGPKPNGQGTVRSIMSLFPLDQMRETVALAMSYESFNKFTVAVEQAHNAAHAALGGDMNTLDYSAYDPMFWMLHCNVDRIWYRWQLQNPNAVYSDIVKGHMQDSNGVFTGQSQIDDLSRWTVASDVPVTAAPAPAPATPAPVDRLINVIVNGTVTSTVVEADKESAALIMNPSNALQTELFPLPVAYHLVLKLLQIPSSADPLRIEVFLDSVCVGNIYVFGTGVSGMPFKMDPPLDITYGYMKTCPNKSPAEVMQGLSILVHNMKTHMVDTGFSAASMLEWLHF